MVYLHTPHVNPPQKEFATKLEENEVTIGKMKAHLDRLDSRDKAHGDKVKQVASHQIAYCRILIRTML